MNELVIIVIHAGTQLLGLSSSLSTPSALAGRNNCRVLVRGAALHSWTSLGLRHEIQAQETPDIEHCRARIPEECARNTLHFRLI